APEHPGAPHGREQPRHPRSAGGVTAGSAPAGSCPETDRVSYSGGPREGPRQGGTTGTHPRPDPRVAAGTSRSPPDSLPERRRRGAGPPAGGRGQGERCGVAALLVGSVERRPENDGVESRGDECADSARGEVDGVVRHERQATDQPRGFAAMVDAP